MWRISNGSFEIPHQLSCSYLENMILTQRWYFKRFYIKAHTRLFFAIYPTRCQYQWWHNEFSIVINALRAAIFPGILAAILKKCPSVFKTEIQHNNAVPKRQLISVQYILFYLLIWFYRNCELFMNIMERLFVWPLVKYWTTAMKWYPPILLIL